MNAGAGIKRLFTVVVCIAASVFSVRVDAGLNTNDVPVVINEVLASNSRILADPQGHFDDWIELYNRGNEAFNLAGLYLTDDPDVPTKWRFPTTNASLTTIAPQGYLIVWADGDTAAAGLHAAFKLNAEGETVALYDRDGASLIDNVTFGPQRTDVSYGRIPNGADSWMPLAIPTPGAQNFSIYDGFVEKPRFSPERGFYGGEILVTIACDTPGTVIYYTTDGTEPYSTATMRLGAGAAMYNGPIRVSKTTCLRAVATRPNWNP
ncbi:MAG TPA: lamin tail domain-containing protein, partial [Sedimentisphaerales bacterium]|nr:lamin tail domain-containing protein [Sedimentisphaerales bacterium]